MKMMGCLQDHQLDHILVNINTVKHVYNGHFQDQLSLNAGQKFCRMLQCEHSAILSTYIKLHFLINIFLLPIFEWLLTQVILYVNW